MSDQNSILISSFVMVCDALRFSGLHARYTDEGMSYVDRCGESCETLSCWGLILIMNEEFLVSASQQLALITSPALCATFH